MVTIYANQKTTQEVRKEVSLLSNKEEVSIKKFRGLELRHLPKEQMLFSLDCLLFEEENFMGNTC